MRSAVKSCTSVADFSRLVTCKGRRSLLAMFDCFNFFTPIVQGQLAGMEELAYRFCKRQADQHIIYTEVRYSPHAYAQVGETVDPQPVVDAVTRGLRRGC